MTSAAIAEPAVREDATAAPATDPKLARALLLESVLLGALADQALRASAPGAGWSVWVAALCATTWALARRGASPLTREQTGWLSLAVVCAALVSWRHAELLQVANLFATVFALSLVGLSRLRDTMLGARVRDVIEGCLRSFVSAIGSAPRWLGEAEIGSGMREAVERRTPILRAIALTVPIILVFGNLLGSADPVFDTIFTIPGIDIGNFVGHVVMAGIFAWGAAGWMRSALVPKQRGSGAWSDAILPEVMPRLGTVEVTSMLGATTGLFALFVGMQLRWLFGGAELVQATTGLSVAEYARRGFFELLTVAILVLPMILVTGAMVAGNEGAERRHRRLAVPVIGLLGFILLSAVMRMNLYVGYFGLSTDRLYALVFMGWLAFVFACLVATVLRGRPRAFVTLSLVGGFATLTGLNIANPEAIVARSQTAVVRERPVDRLYIARLSGDAMPVVASWLAANPPRANAGDDCLALGRLISRWEGESTRGVTGFNLGEYSGRRAVQNAVGARSFWRQCAVPVLTPAAPL